MTLPVPSTDVWKLASEADWLRALILLGALPSREADSSGIDKAAYYLALEGTTVYGLGQAAKEILKGGLGHAFFPSPAELRMQCDAVMRWHVSMRDRIQRQERMRTDNVDTRADPTAAERARVAKLYAEFCKGYEKAASEETFKLDPALVALIPDNPKASTFKRAKAEF